VNGSILLDRFRKKTEGGEKNVRKYTF